MSRNGGLYGVSRVEIRSSRKSFAAFAGDTWCYASELIRCIMYMSCHTVLKNKVITFLCVR